MIETYDPTAEQAVIIAHDGAAFVTACPGAGKTRTMVERARILLLDRSDRRGVAFLSFTNAAVDELEARLRAFGILPTPLFPSFIGTFDRFLWQFFIAPFGMPGCASAPRLIPDKNDWVVQPHESMQALPLGCFDRDTGKVDAALARQEGYNFARDIGRHETRALNMITASKSRGQIDFDDVRACVKARLSDPVFSKRLGLALAGRFREIVVDEAQDCNPADLQVVQWLRDHGIVVKVICDPNQSIYQFRGGVTDELIAFRARFDAEGLLPMTGNFRSSPAICAAIAALRPPALRGEPDIAIGRNRSDATPVHILSYRGSGVSAAIGPKYGELLAAAGIGLIHAPVLASRLASACKAVGHPTLGDTSHLTLLLAQAAMNYHFAFSIGSRRDALVALHRTVLLVQERIGAIGEYHSYVLDAGLGDGRWRPAVIEIANGLRLDPAEDSVAWLQRARTLLGAGLCGTSTIGQRLRSNAELATALATAPTEANPARTIHSAKGLEFPAVCVVLTARKSGDILDCLEGVVGAEAHEDARKIYVAVSRAERLLAIAIPKSKAARLDGLLRATGCTTALHEI